jgi:hypothetical protein
MQDKPSGAADECATCTAGEDARDQAAILRHVLDLYPQTLTLDELLREVTIASPEFSDQDATRRAVRDLAAVGLLHQEGRRILPTRAAVVFHSLCEA